MVEKCYYKKIDCDDINEFLLYNCYFIQCKQRDNFLYVFVILILSYICSD